ncbi:MAG TPA: DUF4253 domain-containing protein [Actinospica sp.]|nr:DUF4253 domain-containing protein [Actinospica sp.]
MNEDLIAALSLEPGLPPGRLITAKTDSGEVQPLWMSDAPSDFDDWRRAFEIRAKRPGLWPVLLDGPWPASAELRPEQVERIAGYDAAELLAAWWREHALPYVEDGGEEGEEDEEERSERLETIAPFGDDWPGLAPAISPDEDPDATLEEFGDLLLSFKDELHLGLVEARSGAEALVAMGWSGPTNYGSTAEFAAVVADWEQRFGVRVVTLEFDVLRLSVPTPPKTLAEALPIAAEHFAFCPDNIWQGEDPCTLQAYAERLIGQESWFFWWD